MVKDLFGNILDDLGKILHIEGLEPDRNNSCLIQFPGKPKVQLEIDPGAQKLIIGCALGELSAGKYREMLFKEALKSNGMNRPLNGAFSFSKRTNQLLLSEELPLESINPDQIALTLLSLLEKAKMWQEAMNRGEVPQSPEAALTGKSGPKMFGIS